jgi:hypothetical protein
VVRRQGWVQFLNNNAAPLVGYQVDKADQDDDSGEGDGLIYRLAADGFSFDRSGATCRTAEACTI